jgi:hypothetical protein
LEGSVDWWAYVDWWTVVGTAVGIFAGGVLNWLFTRRTSREVRLILRALAVQAEGRNVEFRRNDKGEIVGFRFRRSISDAVSVSDTSLDVKREPRRREDEDTDPEQE